MSPEKKDLCEICLQNGTEVAASTARILAHHPDPDIEDCPCGGRLVNLCASCEANEMAAEEAAMESPAFSL